MARSHIRHITLSRWFPANDPLATLVARLCILREDYLLELQGLIKKDFNPFDVRSSASEPDVLEALFDKTAKLVFIVGSIDRIFDAYVAGRGLINGT